MATQLERGFRSGNLTVIGLVDRSKGQYNCVCDCGGTRVVEGFNLRSEKVKSCGCKQYGPNSERRTVNEFYTVDDFVTIMLATNVNWLTAVNTSDIALINKRAWNFDPPSGYMRSNIGGRTITLQRYLLDLGNSPLVADHFDRNKDNYLRSNLRPLTRRQNAKNVGDPIPFFYKGIYWLADNEKLREVLKVGQRHA